MVCVAADSLLTETISRRTFIYQLHQISFIIIILFSPLSLSPQSHPGLLLQQGNRGAKHNLTTSDAIHTGAEHRG